MDRLPRLRGIGKPGIGYDVIDVEQATARGLPSSARRGSARARSPTTR